MNEVGHSWYLRTYKKPSVANFMISFSDKNHTLFRTFDSVKLKRNTQSTNESNLIAFEFTWATLVFGLGKLNSFGQGSGVTAMENR